MLLHTIPDTDRNEEANRIKDLDSYGILDSLPEKKYDDITRLASFICGTEVSLITLMDSERNWFKSIQGDPSIEEKEIPRDVSFCKVTIQGIGLYEIKDASVDKEWKNSPIVKEHNIKYYAGYPLVSPKGYKLGTLCVVDREPRQLTLDQKNALRTLANSVVSVFELDKNKAELQRKNKELAEVNARLYQFGRMIAHDLKSPLQSIKSLYELMRYDHENTSLYEDKMQSYIDRMAQMIDGLLAFARNNLNSLKKEKVDVKKLLDALIERLGVREIKYTLDDELPIIQTEGVLLEIIFQNLISNAVKYCNCEFARVRIGVFCLEPLTFYVEDNGVGISKESGERIFDPFIRLENKQDDGCGIGLYTVKTILLQRGGKIWYDSQPGEGTTFYFEWKI
ncbi:GAF domain-containing sensor histidine kinase [Ekhidna sp.]|uniref:GAF domain-containing sensor histidine kinase n=1 Tax=Ekhidna sp. TaxID=2608089 RepID=UPI0032990844